MSTEQLHDRGRDLFLWTSEDDAEDFIQVDYLIRTKIDGVLAAVGMAREQSLCADSLDGVNLAMDLKPFRAKVVSVRETEEVSRAASTYFLNTPVYGSAEDAASERSYLVTIAYPVRIFDNRLTRVWNNIFGEIHRLGFLGATQLKGILFPDSYAARFPGPSLGVSGLRGKLGVPQRPIFCRSMRPAIGLDTAAMLRLNEAVLCGGFDAIKDDELTYDTLHSPFDERIRCMVDMKHRIEDATGEKKFYFANVIEDLPESLAMAERAAKLGADGLMVSPYVQGLSIISEVARRTGLAVLAHNTCGDALTRLPNWGASQAAMALMQRAAGADLIVSPGPFATAWQDQNEAGEFIDACQSQHAHWAASLPMIMGGKRPDQLRDYIAACGSTDFMIIAATWVDEHPQGMQAGARAFRKAWEEIEQGTGRDA